MGYPRIGIGVFVGTNSGGGETSVLQPWYDSLSVKPSAGLWTDLKIMADGMNSDGDWVEADFVSLNAALETDEQRYKPLKTTSSSDIENVSSTPSTSSAGIIADGLSTVSSKWNPSVNKVKYTLNSAYFGQYINTNTVDYFSQTSGDSSFSSSNTVVASLQGDNSFQSFDYGLMHNDGEDSPQIFLNPPDLSQNLFYSVSVNGGNIYSKLNNLSDLLSSSPISIPNVELLIIDLTSDKINCRATIAGSGLINHNRIAARLNTFFASRGLTTY